MLTPQTPPIMTNGNKVDAQMRSLQDQGMGTAQAVNKAARSPMTQMFAKGGVALKDLNVNQVAEALPKNTTNSLENHVDSGLFSTTGLPSDKNFRYPSKEDVAIQKKYDDEITAGNMPRPAQKPPVPEGTSNAGGIEYNSNGGETVQQWLDKNFPIQQKQNMATGGDVHQVDYSTQLGPDQEINWGDTGGGSTTSTTGGGSGDSGGGIGDMIGPAISIASMFFDRGGSVPAPQPSSDKENPPPGALKNEVADNVPANLSEGEFVFSADATRYWGLKTLVGMVEMARTQLSKLDSSGGISGPGEPVATDTTQGQFKQDAKPNPDTYAEGDFGPEQDNSDAGEGAAKGGLMTMPQLNPPKIPTKARKSVRGPKVNTTKYGEGKYEVSPKKLKKGGLMKKAKGKE